MDKRSLLVMILVIGGMILAACSTTQTSAPTAASEIILAQQVTDTPQATETANTQRTPEATAVGDTPSPTTALGEPTIAPTATLPASDEDEYEIVTLLPRDAIQAIFKPEFQTAGEADIEYEPDEPVMGVVFEGEARAYSISHLSLHEVVNDEVSGRPIAVTW